jgi:dTDP-4-dehydrorhamnose reductase
MKIILLGASGYVGSWIQRYFEQHGHEVRGERIDVTNLVCLRDGIASSLGGSTERPYIPRNDGGGGDVVVINATGKTGRPNVDWCEDNKEETYKVNVGGAVNVADVCRELGLYMVQIGSGCVFDSFEDPPAPLQGEERSSDWEEKLESEGIRVFGEEDEPNFFGSFYSQTKAVCENILREYANVCTLRIRMPLSAEPNERNLLDKILKYDRILSVPNSVTIMEHFMPFLEQVCMQRVCGVLNAVNPGWYEHRDLLELYRDIVDSSKSFEYIGLEAFEGMTKAARSNCVLSTSRCKELGIEMPEVGASLTLLLQQRRMLANNNQLHANRSISKRMGVGEGSGGGGRRVSAEVSAKKKS